jgi:hypothetical protein
MVAVLKTAVGNTTRGSNPFSSAGKENIMDRYEKWDEFVAKYAKRAKEIGSTKLSSEERVHPSLFICGLMKIYDLTGKLDLTAYHDYVAAWELPTDMSQEDMDYLIKCGLTPTDDDEDCIELSWVVDHGVR